MLYALLARCVDDDLRAVPIGSGHFQPDFRLVETPLSTWVKVFEKWWVKIRHLCRIGVPKIARIM